MPAHVTVLYPFRAPQALDDRTLHDVAAATRSVSAFRTEFTDVGLWPGVVWLRPEPDDGFRALTRATFERFPEHPPYEGMYPDTIPHLTVGQHLDDAQSAEVVDVMREGLRSRPITCDVKTVALWASDDVGRWRPWHRWPLA